MNKTRIEWCDMTYNPVWGCTFGCPYCYARGTAKRWGKQIAGRDDFVPTFIERNFRREFPKEPSRIFVNSMSDIADWEPEWMRKVLARIEEAPRHAFLFLTKRPVVYGGWTFPKNAWMGVTATSGEAPRAPLAPREGVAPRFLSIEPLLGPIDSIDPLFAWAIIGAESGHRKEKVIPRREWIQDIVGMCRSQGIAVFFKESITKLFPDFTAREFPGDL
ncbi:MAG: DUF5131 family protein [Rectinemataceae bacterium]